MITKLKEETNCQFLTISGGEPFLRDDILQIINHVKSLDCAVTLITNGTFLADEELVKDCLKAGVSLFELPLLSWQEKVHDQLSGHESSWRRLTQAMVNIKKHKGNFITAFIATKKNIKDIEMTIKLAVALGTDSVMVNRFNAGGNAKIKELMPTPAMLKKAFTTANRLAVRYGLRLNTSIPVQDCVLDMSLFPEIKRSYCAVGGDYAYYVIDFKGNVRPCPHSPTVLGNFLKQKMKDILANPCLAEFCQAVPEVCQECLRKNICQGGCRASAQVCYGSIYEEDPFLKLGLKKGLGK